MTLTTHAAMGAFIGHSVQNPLLAFVLGFAGHLLIDMIPHGDGNISDNYRVHKRKRTQAVAYVTVDAITAMFLLLVSFNLSDLRANPSLTAGIIGSILPDFLVGLYELTKIKLLKYFVRFHFFFHDYFLKRKGDVPLSYALVAQALFIAVLQTRF